MLAVVFQMDLEAFFPFIISNYDHVHLYTFILSIF